MNNQNSSFEVVASGTGDPYLLTPGPLTTSETVKQAMLHDYGSRDNDFIDLNQRVLDRLVEMVDGASSHVAVPLQGSGTFVVEAMIGCFVPRDGKLLICVNGAYGHRIASMCQYYQRSYLIQESNEETPIDINELDRRLSEDESITHVAVVYCETTSGILNPIKEISEVVKKHHRGFLIDAMSAFGALPLSSKDVHFDAVVASSNKCLEGAPGMGFCIAREEAIEVTQGNAMSLSLDLYDQWTAMKKNRQWRFTPPTHVLLAFNQALNEFDDEGGVEGRGQRYQSNCDILVKGMRDMGFETLLPDKLQAPIIITFHMPRDSRFEFSAFYDRLREMGYVIYPGKLTIADSFRVGCIGRLDETQMRGVLATIRLYLDRLGLEGRVS